MQELIKTICKSRTYQHSIVTNRWNKDDDINYSHALARRLPAEVLYDAIHAGHGFGEPSCRACRRSAGGPAAGLERRRAGRFPGAVRPAGRAKAPANANAPTA